jgi:hypothetical protein
MTIVAGVAWAGLLVILGAGPAWAAVWCVPKASILPRCPKVAPTIQQAHDWATAGSKIYVGPGNPAERIEITKRVTIIGLPGHLITDAGLGPGEALLRFSGTMSRPTFENLVLDVVTSAAGIVIPASVSYAHFKGVHILSAADPKPAYGLRAAGTLRTNFIRSARVKGRVSGFAVGMEFDEARWVDVEAGTVIEGNDTGLRVRRSQGQIFWNVIRGNRIGLEVCGLFHIDINSNQFADNDLAVLWGLCAEPNRVTGLTEQHTVEFTNTAFHRNAENIRLEVSPGIFSGDYRDDPGCDVEWTSLKFDGIRQPDYRTPEARLSEPDCLAGVRALRGLP